MIKLGVVITFQLLARLQNKRKKDASKNFMKNLKTFAFTVFSYEKISSKVSQFLLKSLLDQNQYCVSKLITLTRVQERTYPSEETEKKTRLVSMSSFCQFMCQTGSACFSSAELVVIGS